MQIIYVHTYIFFIFLFAARANSASAVAFLESSVRVVTERCQAKSRTEKKQNLKLEKKKHFRHFILITINKSSESRLNILNYHSITVLVKTSMSNIFQNIQCRWR